MIATYTLTASLLLGAFAMILGLVITSLFVKD